MQPERMPSQLMQLRLRLKFPVAILNESRRVGL